MDIAKVRKYVRMALQYENVAKNDEELNRLCSAFDPYINIMANGLVAPYGVIRVQRGDDRYERFNVAAYDLPEAFCEVLKCREIYFTAESVRKAKNMSQISICEVLDGDGGAASEISESREDLVYQKWPVLYGPDETFAIYCGKLTRHCEMVLKKPTTDAVILSDIGGFYSVDKGFVELGGSNKAVSPVAAYLAELALDLSADYFCIGVEPTDWEVVSWLKGKLIRRLGRTEN